MDDHKSRFIDLLPTTRAWRVLGHYEKEIDPSEVGSATPEANKMYRVYNAKTKTISDSWSVKPFLIRNPRRRNAERQMSAVNSEITQQRKSWTFYNLQSGQEVAKIIIPLEN